MQTTTGSDFSRLLDAHRRDMLASALRLTRSRADADDLVQEALARAWQFRESFQHGTSPRAWLHRILVNTFINGYRKRRREREVLAQASCEPETRRSSAPSAGQGAFGDEVEAALATLSPDFRAVLLGVDRDEGSYEDVARMLGCPVGTVMSRLHRARRALQRRLAGYAVTNGYVSEEVVSRAA